MVWEQWYDITDGRADIRTDGWTDGRAGASQYPRFFFEKRGDNNIFGKEVVVIDSANFSIWWNKH